MTKHRSVITCACGDNITSLFASNSYGTKKAENKGICRGCGKVYAIKITELTENKNGA